MPTKRELQNQLDVMCRLIKILQTSDDLICFNIFNSLEDEVYAGCCGKLTKKSEIVICGEAPYTITCGECADPNREFACINCGEDCIHKQRNAEHAKNEFIKK